jgi:mannosyltransferase OCH1-like enzyme
MDCNKSNKYIFYFIIILLLYKLLINNKIFKEFFYDFKNIPENYNEEIKDINISPKKGISKIIHHICPKDYKRWHNKWFIGYESTLRMFPSPEYEHMYWYDDELHKFIESDFPWFLNIFNSYDVNIKRIDMIRPFILYKYGGIYLDMDYVIYKNFYDQLPEDKVSIPKSPYEKNEYIQNAFLCTPPKHNFWLLIIDECYKHKDEHVFNASGPQLYTQIYFKYPNLVNILPVDEYNPSVDDKIAFKRTDIYAKHLLSTSW